jgi:hypothetical protein
MTSAWRDQGNAFFKQGQFEQARAAYTSGIEETCIPTEKTALLSNRAACHLELGDFSAAATDCRLVIDADPCHAKAHYRLAKACLNQADCRTASIAACCALALCGEAGVLNLYQEVNFRLTFMESLFAETFWPIRSSWHLSVTV